MTDWKAVGKKLAYPPWWVTLPLALVSAAGLLYVFLNGLDTTPVAFVIYVLSAYTVTAVTFWAVKLVPGWYRRLKALVHGNKYGHRYLTDISFKTHVALYRSLAVNLLYVAVNLFTGVWYRSVWFITLAVYYLILAAIRFQLLRFARRNDFGTDLLSEWRQARVSCAVLLLINVALSGIVLLVIVQNRSFEYAGILIYVMAMYTFYITTSSIISIVRYRKYKSPVISTTKVISLAAALISMLALETAMLSQFRTETTSPYFERIMVGATGAGVCLVVLSLSFYMIFRASREIRKHKAGHPPSQTKKNL